MSATRIYLVKGPFANRLVKASTAAQAISHVIKPSYTAHVASQEDLVEALSEGITVEIYGEEHDSGSGN